MVATECNGGSRRALHPGNQRVHRCLGRDDLYVVAREVVDGVAAKDTWGPPASVWLPQLHRQPRGPRESSGVSAAPRSTSGGLPGVGLLGGDVDQTIESEVDVE